MSIQVKGVTKLYGAQKALNDVSFTIKTGEVVGLLGPNGAGKSTLMKIITCFIPPSEGNAFVNEYNVLEQSAEVRKRVGYLPENNPLYVEMYVKEYLEFVAGIYKVPNKKEQIEKMIQLTGLTLEQNKKINALSKGYRQRVGIAQALIHDPEVLILDEPTSGLDPNQLVEIRNLISEVGKEKTVILSTHIMQEVEAMCDRVIIIDRGIIVADDTTSNISSRTNSGEVVIVEFDSDVEKKKLHAIKGVVKVEHISKFNWKLFTNDKIDIRPDVFQFAVSNKLKVLGLSKEEQNLEMIFQKLTKKQ